MLGICCEKCACLTANVNQNRVSGLAFCWRGSCCELKNWFSTVFNDCITCICSNHRDQHYVPHTQWMCAAAWCEYLHPAIILYASVKSITLCRDAAPSNSQFSARGRLKLVIKKVFGFIHMYAFGFLRISNSGRIQINPRWVRHEGEPEVVIIPTAQAKNDLHEETLNF